MSNKGKEELFFFSLGEMLIPLDTAITFDLYINSSSLDHKRHFVKIKKQNDKITVSELADLKTRFLRFYAPESQRSLVFRSLTDNHSLSKTEKIDMMKSFSMQYMEKIFDPQASEEKIAEAIAGSQDVVKEMIVQLKNEDFSTTQDIISELSVHDFYTFDHSVNVSIYSISLYKVLNPDATQVELLTVGLAGLLHDVGKIKISNKIINKPDVLTAEEMAEIKKHPIYGLDIFEKNSCHFHGEFDLVPIKKAIYQHHENYNGTGYPNKLKGTEISYVARIVTIVDFYDAITTKRSYSNPLKTEDAVQLMSKSVGKKIDPELFEIFQKNLKQLIFTGKENKVLPDEFDPCQPQRTLPFTLPKAKSKKVA